jgi:multiple sugar transport system permease protein
VISFQRGQRPSSKIASKGKTLSLQRYEATVGFLFLLPWLLGFLLLKFIPILVALGFSFTNFYMLTPAATRFVGLVNYIRLLHDPRAGASLFGSVSYFLLTVPLEMIVALALAALFASDRLRGKRLLRVLFFLPSIIPATAILFIWIGLTAPGTGWLSQLLLGPLNLPSVRGYGLFPIIMALWSIGPGFLIMLGAMQGVSKDLYEAARVDGAGPMARFVMITLPIISPAIFFSLVINLTTAFGGAALLDRGNLFQTSLSPMEGYINSTMFSQFQLGYASALAWAMFAVTMTITIFLFRTARRWVYFPEEQEEYEY